jgi:molybdopterin-guanine dinucleotide biosynthesis protein A
MVSIAVQAGGRSRRMGRDKALIPLAGKRLIEYALDHLQGLTDDLFITTNQPELLKHLGLRLVPDEVPGQGALYGLRTALLAAQHDNVLIVACDMPFIQRELIEHMFSLAGQADVIIPEQDGNFEPMLALYRASTCLPEIERALKGQQFRVISFFPGVSILPIDTEVLDLYDPHRLSFFNINTPEEIQQAEEILRNFPSAQGENNPNI